MDRNKQLSIQCITAVQYETTCTSLMSNFATLLSGRSVSESHTERCCNLFQSCARLRCLISEEPDLFDCSDRTSFCMAQHTTNAVVKNIVSRKVYNGCALVPRYPTSEELDLCLLCSCSTILRYALTLPQFTTPLSTSSSSALSLPNVENYASMSPLRRCC